MHVFNALPAGYREHRTVDLQKDKKKSLLINGAAGAATVLLLIAGNFLLVPVSAFFDAGPDDSFWRSVLLKPVVLMVGVILYVLLHELTHGAAMKAFGASHVRFGFTGLYAYAGSEQDWFDRTAYLVTALAPLTVWGVIFAVAAALVPRSWFWVVYLWQVINVSGAAGDLYVSFLTARMPRTVLCRDTGVSMSFFLPADS